MHINQDAGCFPMKTTSFYLSLSSIRADASRGRRGRLREACVAGRFKKKKKRSEEQEEYYNFEMIIALSACVGVSIRVSWCKKAPSCW